jgi:hypothetical protein
VATREGIKQTLFTNWLKEEMKEGEGEGEREEEEGGEEVVMEEEEGMERYSCYEFIELQQDFSKETSLVADIWLG